MQGLISGRENDQGDGSRINMEHGRRSMKKIYYIGFYNGQRCKERTCGRNLAASVKIDFTIDTLKQLGYHVHLISICLEAEGGFSKLEHIRIDELEEHTYIPYFSLKIKGRSCLAGKTAGFFLKMYAFFRFKKDDIVMTYHSLAYGRFWAKLHERIGFRWISEVNEIYCLSQGDYQDSGRLEKEIRMFSSSDGYLFANDVMAKKYANGKPYAICYGNYNVYASKEAFQGKNIKIVYTGIINQDRGVYNAISAMKYLTANYEIHILGFGSAENMEQMWEHIRTANQENERVFFEGTKAGKEYTEFLLRHQIGISLMDTSAEISENAFPSKILTYLGHSLFVVSSRCPSIVNSNVADSIYFCGESEEDIAKTILQIPIFETNSGAAKLKKLNKQLLNDLENVLSGS